MGKPTRIISLKSIAMLFPPGSIERVYLHGKWQQSRGRNPSMRYGNHPTPRESFAAVEAMVGQYFDEIRRQDNSRQDFFWHWRMIEAVMDRAPVHELPSVWEYR